MGCYFKGFDDGKKMDLGSVIFFGVMDTGEDD